MSEIFSKNQTRGRPRKKTEEKLPPLSRKLFSEHSAVFYACCMVYVLEVFLKTKQEKRIGHSQGGFTIYEKNHINTIYCFETLQEDIKEWGFDEVILPHQDFHDFVRTANGCAPKFVFKELVTLFVLIHNFILDQGITSIQELDHLQPKLLNLPETDLNRMFKYIRFTIPALKELKLEKWSSEVNQKIEELWAPFLKIVSYTIFCVERGIQRNRYLKPFFSDAEHPQQTIIGQLNLKQIVDEREDKNFNTSFHLGFTKIKQDQKQKGKVLDYQNSCNEIPSFSNKRPITMITFPSNSKLDMTSPCKQGTSIQGVRSYDELDEIQPLSSMKKVKED